MKKINSTDIAKLAGVSRSTVSRVVNGYPNVPPETKEKVMKIIKENAYYPLLSGQLLAGKRTGTVGVFWVRTGNIANDYFTSSFFMHITESAAQRGYLVLSCIIKDIQDKKNINWIKSIFMQGRIDGGIFVGVNNNEPIVEELIGYGKIAGIFDHYREGVWEPNRLSVNFEKSTGEKTIDYVYAKGHRKIAVVDGNMNRFSSIQRHEGYLRGMQKYNIQIKNKWMSYGGITQDKGYKAATEMLAACDGDYPTVICANNDGVAFGVYQAIEDFGMVVGKDISVVGIDGHQNGMYSTPRLTTFGFDYHDMFASLVNRTIDTIEQKENVEPTEFIESKLIERDSCADIN